MDFEEPEEHALMRESIARICGDFGHRWFQERARNGEKSTELWRTLGRHGFIGLNVPEEYGGAGGGITELCILCEEAAAAGTPLLLLVVSQAIGATVISAFGTAEQKEMFLPRLASGEAIMAFAITEPDAGSNSHNITTWARRDGDRYLINGTKTFISGVDEAEWILLVARTGTDERGRAALSLFVVDADAPGLEKSLIETIIQAPEKQWLLHFDNVEVGADRLIGHENQGLKAVFHGLNPERITSAAMAVGLGRYALERAAGYARDRCVWGVPIGTHQGLAHPLAECKIQLELAALMTKKAAWLFDHGKPAGEAANMAKYAAAEAAIASIDQAMQVHGGNGLTVEYGIGDLWAMARLTRTAPVSREMILNFVAQHSLGLPKSY
jgi:alkylation response protein AidB-like acyl-CoA dehydrogenase